MVTQTDEYFFFMRTLQILLLVSFVFGLNACQNPENTIKDDKKADTTSVAPEVVIDNSLNDPCNSPKTVQQLLACAGQFGTIDSSYVIDGIIANNGACLPSWNDADTVLEIWYSDSITLFRVQPSADISTDIYGSWFSNTNALASGLTKQQTLNLYALNNCSNFNYDTCYCNGVVLPPDSLIQYEVTAGIGPNQKMLFGAVGPNRFGTGGNLQWHLTDRKSPPYLVINQEYWP